MKKPLCIVIEFWGIQYFSKKEIKTLILFFSILVFLMSPAKFYSQTIPSTGTSANPCGDCTPTGWFDTGGTPDISNRFITGGQGYLGGGATWVGTAGSPGVLPLPPSGQLTWITIRDVGTTTGTNNVEESVTTNITGLIIDNYYVVSLYAMSALSNPDGGDNSNAYYSGTYLDAFDYQLEYGGTQFPRQTILNIPQEEWSIVKYYFRAPATTVQVTFFPRTDGGYNVNGNTNSQLLESVNIAIDINAVSEIDTDGDGVPDSVDIDDDNDGILDTEELTSAGGITYDPLGDEDGDALPNYLDVRDDNNSTDGSTTDYNDINGDGIPNVFDADNDGIPNHLDLDSDGDGIPDIIEGQATTGYIAPTGVVGANGLDSAFENNDTASATSFTVINTDSGVDTIPDYLDLDSDNDGISDQIEANSILTGEEGDNGLDDAYENLDTYIDPNGIFDNTQLDNFPNTSSADAPDDVDWRDNGTALDKDTDGDGITDTVDIDDDNDGILDTEECTTANTTGSNADSVESQTSVSDAGDAIGSDNSRAGLNNLTDILVIDLGVDVANNTIIEIESRVTNNIDHFMGVEQSLNGTDFSNEVFYTWTATDTEENKEYTLTTTSRYLRIRLAVDGGGGQLEIDNVSYQGFTTTCDDDGDGIPNQFDLDSDNDGIPDNIEGQPTAGYIPPTGSVGANGLYDIYENNDTAGATSFTPSNTDGDANPDYLDTDSDDDGTPDRVEANLSLSGNFGANGLDANYDNGDTYVDVNGSFDTDPYPDFPNTSSADSPDEIDWRDSGRQFTDNDNDGIPDNTDLDDDNDGILDTVEGSADTDGDGIIDAFDLDSDNDGIPDNIEAQTTSGYVIPNGVFDSNGVDTAYTGGITPQDTDGDSAADYLENDSDNDGILDNIEANLILSGTYGNNGLDNNYDNGDSYTDVNGSFDNSQTDNFPDDDNDVFTGGDVDYRDDTFTFDTDGDGINDEVDLDDDNDGILDAVEQGNCLVNNANLTWDLEYGGDGNDPATVNSGITTVSTVDITLQRVGNVSSDSDYEIGSSGVSNNTTSYIFNQRALFAAESRHIFTFKAPVKNLGFTIYDIDADNGDGGISIDNVEIIITKQDGTNYTLVPADYNLAGTSITYSAVNTFQNDVNEGDNDDDLEIISIPVYITKIQIVFSNLGSGSIPDFQSLAIGDFSYCAPLDSDGDGVFDYIDLDADNDGIPDNIEAQTTAGYVAPSGSFSITGIDLAYGSGLSAENTDGDADPDYLDLDSDNDGTFDILESGSGLTDANTDGRTDDAVGNNGLDNTLDNGDTYNDVNGSFDNTVDDNFTDTDGDVNLGGDLDYRDAINGLDTDGDGVSNALDIDDDNDGILDVDEGGACSGNPVAGFEAYYTYEDTTDDISGNNHNLIALEGTGPVSYSSTAKTGEKSLNLNGDYFLRYNDGSFMNDAITFLSYSMWINPTSLLGTQHLIDEGGATNGIAVRLNENIIEAAVRESNVQQNLDTSSLPTLATGTWYHVVIVYNNGNVTLYLDGTATPTLATGFAELLSHSDGSGIGGRFNDSAFDNNTTLTGDEFTGLIDEFLYYQGSFLTPADVANLDISCTSSDLTPPDTDEDGIPNYLDIDSDNDGIPDNVEAQLTLSTNYIAPSGIGSGITDTDGDGLDDNYDSNLSGSASSVGLTPVDTDSDLNPDYLDTDTDNDAIFDIGENQVPNTIDVILDLNTGNSSDGIPDGILDPSNFVDTDGDGLADVFEGSDINDGFDVNDEINIPQSDLPDEDLDVSTGGDVDYRDDTTDPINPGVAGNILWLRADIAVTGTTEVTSWEDQANTTPFVATSDTGTAPSKIDIGLNFNPVIDFDGSNQDLIITNGILGTATYTNLWSYVVINPNNVGGNDFVFIEDMDDGNFHNRTVNNTNLRYRFGQPTTQFINITSEENSYNLYTLGSTSTGGSSPTGNTQAIHAQGEPIFTANNAIAGADGNNDNFDIGSNGANNFWNGQIAEIMVFNETPSAAKQQQVESYLAIKYGFTLSTIEYQSGTTITEGDYVLQDQSTKVWDYTANSLYHNDVAGIGKDDALALEQKQSKSINSDAIITIGLEAIATSNATNANSFSTNKDFLMWGNDNGVITTITETELICAPEKTIGRTWKIVENGNVGKVQIAVEQAPIDAALNTTNTIKVLKIADDAAFTTNVVYIPVTLTNALYVADYNFNGTKYFTYSEINGIFWFGENNAWTGGNSSSTSGAPSENIADIDKVMVVDSSSSNGFVNPTLTENAIVECVWIKEGSKLMVANENYLEFDEDFILDGEIRLIGDGQLVQTHIGLSNVQGDGKLYKDQAAVVPSKYRYHYWSSPVRELNLDSFRVGEVMKDGNNPTSATSTIREITWEGVGNIYDGEPGSFDPDVPIKIAPYWIYSFLDGTDRSGWVQKFETGVIQRGQGYTMKSTGQNPQNFTFVGTPNDGSITFNFTSNKTSLLGNPYPSALDAVDFITTNTDAIDGTLYFWEHTGEDASNPASTEGHNFSGYQGGYSQRNIAMGIAANNVVIIPLVLDWEDAVVNNGVVTQTESNITATVSTNEGDLELVDQGPPNDNVIKNDAGVTSQTVTITFSAPVNIATIFLFNDNGPGDIDLTITSGSNIATPTLTDNVGQAVNLGWQEITSLTIEGSAPYNLGIDQIKFTDASGPSLGNGVYHAPGRYVAVGQGFFVSSSPSGGTVRFENAQRNYRNNDYDNGGTFFFKGDTESKESQEPLDLLPIIKLGFNYVGVNQVDLHRQIGISFKRGNNFEYDNGFDSEIYDIQPTDFYWNFPDFSPKKLIIAGVGEISNHLEVPLTLVISNNEPVSIELDEIKNIDQEVYIEDKLTGNYHLLTEDMEIELNLEEGTYKDRFFLTFKQTVLNLEDDPVISSGLSLYMDNNANEIVINNKNNTEISKVALFNILGQKIKEWKNIGNLTEHRLQVNKLSSTVYIVKILTPRGKISKKIIIE